MYELRVTAVIVALLWAQAATGTWLATIWFTFYWLLVEARCQPGSAPTLRSCSECDTSDKPL